MEAGSGAQAAVAALGETARTARRIRNVLFAAQSLGSAAFLVASTVNAIAGAMLGGSAAWAGAPSATYQAGQAMAAFLWGRLMDPLGRRATLASGLLVGVLGASVASRSVSSPSLLPFLIGLLLMGFAQSAMQLGRFVSAEVHPPHERGRAISFVVLGAPSVRSRVRSSSVRPDAGRPPLASASWPGPTRRA
jgi:MFS family permease